MHYRYIVLFDKEKANTSKEARTFVQNYLLGKKGFLEQGDFSSGMADWFVIGGRWSGKFTKSLLDKEKLENMYKELGDNHWYLGGKDQMTEEKRLKEYTPIFKKYFPDFKGILPDWRNSYNQEGFEDDAQIVSKELWDNFVKDIVKKNAFEEVCSIEGDIDNTSKETDVIGKKWVVVVDYHY